ncbi:FGGY-family carbohydrate kinase [Pontibacter mangrovi]|uniref:Sugar kinase n=1 Tax=Pontibacter mangrovi TaxID=2589816 RepID=A0A501VY91_9BACT|nr:FGGY family carbohydrate kinase [Pontibacter mangrovi]TPE42379.1 sugar kinase [Pontibacter mangrovi]
MATQEAYLILDIGTGNVRVAVATPQGKVLCVERDSVRYETDTRYPDALWFDPAMLWEQILALAVRALQQLPGWSIKAITASSQREGVVLLAEDGGALIGFPNHDHRGREWESMLTDKERIYQLTGRYPSSLFSALKVVGLRERQPELFNACKTMLSISDWAQFQLSGVKSYEHSQASETQLYDVASKSWSEELCTAFGLDSRILPELRASGTILGKVLPAYARRLQISPETVVVVGGADTQLAIKSTRPSVDDIVIVSGTTTPVTKIMTAYRVDAQERTWTNRHVEKDRFILETNAGVTGLNYQRLKEIFYPNESYEVIERELAAVPASQCVASLGSLIADEKVPVIRGGFSFNVPVSHELTRACFVRAALWDIACCIKANYDALCQVTDHTLDYVWACGGGMQSPMLRQFMATLLNKKVLLREGFEQASVVGGALVCNQAIGRKEGHTAVAETVYPAQQEYDPQLEEWRKTRRSFRRGVLEEEVV